MKKLILAGTVALVAFSAAACGRMADLEAPPARESERSMRGDWGEDIQEPATVNRPPSQMPIDGGPSSSPFGGSGSTPR
jgi:predicted small lipoprotein YifL